MQFLFLLCIKTPRKLKKKKEKTDDWLIKYLSFTYEAKAKRPVLKKVKQKT